MVFLKNALLTLAFALDTSLAWSPTNGYAPGNVTCPDNANFIRKASGLSSKESEWLEKRNAQTQPALKDFLERADISDFDVDEFFSTLTSNVTIGLAYSGGGYRAMLNGAGQLSALDSRTRNANETGLGGLFQSTTYLAGLSGGNWLTGSVALNNWTTIEELVYNDQGDGVWDLSDSIFDSGGWNIFSTLERFKDIGDAIGDKEDAGYNTSLTDIWGRALSYQFFGSDNDASAGLTFSTIQATEEFQNGSVPFPISVADGRVPGTYIISLNSTVFEFNPFELGSWDNSLYAFTELDYIGSKVTNGTPDSDVCVQGYDNGGFVLGTSSSLFNQFILQLNTTGLSGSIYSLINHYLTSLSEDYDDIAIYDNNPFYKTEYGDSSSTLESQYLYLCDGGEDLQNIPLTPLVQPERDVDVIFAFDNSADTDDYLPDGASLVATYERQFGSQGNGTSFPYVPDVNTFISHNLTTKPTFFGCYASNLTSLARIPPLVVYVPNIPYTYWTNTSTFKMSYSQQEKEAIVQNGYEVSSRYNLTIDSDWQKCVSCAIIQRQLEHTNATQPDECKECFDNYCWDGTLDTSNTTYSFSRNLTSSSNIGKPDTSSIGADSSSTSTSTSSSSTASSTSSSGAKKNSAGGHIFGKACGTFFVATTIASLVALTL
ncbi:hypothetical protein WICMUC_002561 [Wickerhamomyces mucosus]|uniref:Lysophospholipase n=1 Tax=Wickerhamomyces mucosus TaxID=1378264 RepID=A0A9P8PQT2_9ASCO|nr:hypothetical protein WICMUC_002561 [Wickerhamomyces mucosus]